MRVLRPSGGTQAAVGCCRLPRPIWPARSSLCPDGRTTNRPPSPRSYLELKPTEPVSTERLRSDFTGSSPAGPVVGVLGVSVKMFQSDAKSPACDFCDKL